MNEERLYDYGKGLNAPYWIQEIKTKVTSGLMQSDGYGGGTANMEFQTLTGLPFYNINPTVSIFIDF